MDAAESLRRYWQFWIDRSRVPDINWVLRADGSVETLNHSGQRQMQAGDAIEIHTPAGGAYGAGATPTFVVAAQRGGFPYCE